MSVRFLFFFSFRRNCALRKISTDNILYKNYHFLKYNNCVNKFNDTSNVLTNFCRTKYTKKTSKQEDDSDSDDENKNEDNFQDEKDSKIVRTKLNSLRADLVLKAGLGMARNKVEAYFYESKIRVNGKKISKKSVQVNIEDEVDIIKGFSQMNPSHLLVWRVKVLSTEDGKENLVVVLRRYKSLIIDNYEGPNAYKSSETSA